ncbi:HAD family hydrolase [Actinoplanes sp. L3-i22]|uniref:HAD family hydrolase n=1 Tax=Actinoplanes sp. L3-i22 TaxID=2836373 RepID=UPI001C7417C5|nr:hypothetical protein L3i22_023910 [Actinoplanes sp. L3-i22]
MPGERDSPALKALRDAGLWVGIAGNQTIRAGGILRKLKLPADLVATSDDWGFSKPDTAFFRALANVTPHKPEETLHVGDRLDNDIRPAPSDRLQDSTYTQGAVGHDSAERYRCSKYPYDANRISKRIAQPSSGIQRDRALGTASKL